MERLKLFQRQGLGLSLSKINLKDPNPDLLPPIMSPVVIKSGPPPRDPNRYIQLPKIRKS